MPLSVTEVVVDPANKVKITSGRRWNLGHIAELRSGQDYRPVDGGRHSGKPDCDAESGLLVWWWRLRQRRQLRQSPV
jgi:hypothetical protein